MKDQALSIKYLTREGKQSRSKSLTSYNEFITWEQEVGPIYTKRTCFSLLCANSDFSSSFLVLYQELMKVVIREFLLKHPKALWDQIVCKETTEKLRSAIKCYFYFVKQKVPRLNLYRYADQNLFVVS